MPSNSVPSGFVRPSQSIGRPTVQKSQRPQFGRRMNTHRSPACRVVDPVTDGLDHAAALVPEHDGERGGGVAEHPVQVGVADAGRLDPDAGLARARLGELDLLDLERLVGREHDRCSGAHDARC